MNCYNIKKIQSIVLAMLTLAKVPYIDPCTGLLVGDCDDTCGTGGGGGGGPTTNTLSFNGATNQITSVVNGVSSTTTLTIDGTDVLTTATVTINGTTYPIGTNIQAIVTAISALSHPAATFTNNAAPFSFITGSQIGNIPQSPSLVDNGDDTITFTKGDGTAPLIINVGGGSGNTDLLLGTRTNLVLDLLSSTGTDVTLPAATVLLSGLMTGTDKTKLDGLVNYVHPNHTGDVTSVADGATTIVANAVTNTKLADMPASTIKLAVVAGDPIDGTVAQAKTLLGYTAADILNVAAGTIAATNVQVALNELDTDKQADLIWQEEGADLALAGVITTINLTGSNMTGTVIGNTLTIDTTGLGTPIMVGATTSAPGSTGTAPAPAQDFQNRFLTGGALYTSSIPEWVNTTAWEVGDIVQNGNVIYRTITAHLGGALNLANFAKLGVTNVDNGLYTDTGDLKKWGGALIEDTLINGSNLYDIDFNNLSSFGITVDNGSSAAKSTFSMSTPLSVGSFLRSEVLGTPTTYGEIRVDADGPATAITQTDGTDTARIATTSTQSAKLETIIGVTTRSIALSGTQHIMANVTSGSNTEILYIDPVSGVITRNAPTGGTPLEYDVASGTANTNLRVVASGAGVTSSFSSNKFTINIPVGVRIFSADLLLGSADIQSAADAGGTTNWIQVKFDGTGGNTSISDMRIPAVQKMSIPTTGALGTNNAGTLDIDNNPQVAAVEISLSSVTIRVGGLSIGAQGYHLKFSNI